MYMNTYMTHVKARVALCYWRLASSGVLSHACTHSLAHTLTHTQEDRATRKAVGIVQQSLVEAQERAKQEQALLQLQEEALDHRALVQVSPSPPLSLPLTALKCCG